MTVDPEAVALFALKVWSYKQGEIVSLMVHLGDRLGLYRTLDGRGPVTAAELAAATGLHERWLREWLRGQAAAGLLAADDDGERFELLPEGALVLAREEGSLAFAAGAFSGGAATPEVVDALADAFRTGRGLTYDQLGPTAAHQTERMLAPWARLALVPVLIPALDGVEAKLTAGARVADVGCGAGVALRILARAFPASMFHGTDLSRLAIERAEWAAADEGLTNVSFSVARAEDVPAGGRVRPAPRLRLPSRHDLPGAGGRCHQARHRRRRDVVDPRDQVVGGLAAGSAQPDAGDDVRLVGQRVHVVGPLGARRGRVGYPRAPASEAGGAV